MESRVELMKAVNLALVQNFPQRPVYWNTVPDDFSRPSFLIQYVSGSLNGDNYSLVEQTAYFTITIFEAVNEYSISSQEELLESHDRVLRIFRAGYVPAGERALKVSASSGGIDENQSFVDLQFTFFDTRDLEQPEYQLMQKLYTTIQEKER